MAQVLVNDTSLSAIGDLIRDNINPSTESVYIRSETISGGVSRDNYGYVNNAFLSTFSFSNITPEPKYLKIISGNHGNDYVQNQAGDKIYISNTTDSIVPIEYNEYYINGYYAGTTPYPTLNASACALDANKQGIRGTSSNGTLLTVDKVYKPSEMASALSDIIDELAAAAQGGGVTLSFYFNGSMQIGSSATNLSSLGITTLDQIYCVLWLDRDLYISFPNTEINNNGRAPVKYLRDGNSSYSDNYYTIYMDSSRIRSTNNSTICNRRPCFILYKGA